MTLQGSDNVSVIEAGLPNITGSFVNARANFTSASGAFTASNYGTQLNADYSKQGTMNMAFNASKSNAIYGLSDTVQPASILLIAQIKF